jgi:hypothetical protein
MMDEITLLEVPFADKESVRALGARWDGQKRKWVVPPGLDRQLFARWLPRYEQTFNLRAIAPFYLITSQEVCWKCGTSSPVITFAAEGIEGQAEDGDPTWVTFCYVAHVPERLRRFLTLRHPFYFRDYSNTVQTYYYLNHCASCSTKIGDYYLHSEPGGGFFPTSEVEARRIVLLELKREGYVQLHADYAVVYPSLMAQYAQRIPFTD